MGRLIAIFFVLLLLLVAAACGDDDGGYPLRITDNAFVDQFAVWSPDGTRLVFESNRDLGPNIYVMNADG